MTKLIFALAVQASLFAVFFYTDARMTVSSVEKIVRFGLRPTTILFFGLSPIAMWWTMSTVYKQLDRRLWLGSFIQGFLIQLVYTAAYWRGSGIAPTPKNAVSLALGVLGILISAL